MIGVGVQGLLADRYQLQDRLGSGAMGEVWRADDRLLGRPVAVKLLRTDEAADAERFRLEARTAGRLNHPNVVGVYDFGSHHGRLYLVMELVDGWSLAQERSLRGALDPHEAAALAAHVASGLAAAHRQGVIHRDVKPANVMLSADRTAKIADFGIARFADEAAAGLTATGKIVGTADYLAPERALGRPAHPASDVYSLGCVLYELLTGRPPFRGATPLAVVRQHVDAAPPPPDRLRPDVPQELSDYVLLLLAKEPAQRPTADEAADWLASYRRVPSAPEPGNRRVSHAPEPGGRRVPRTPEPGNRRVSHAPEPGGRGSPVPSNRATGRTPVPPNRVAPLPRRRRSSLRPPPCPPLRHPPREPACPAP
ncbi:serine/threonine-protein kinase [Streptomyces sp. NPDC017673]|uniref:serine/threonine-protein kinase n=1 Tax=unclassified Streptomyces TaxID=2593676 RepID=UPI00378974B2